MNYNYIYLDPRYECDINVTLGEFEINLKNNPIYVGVGKKLRYLDHIFEAKKIIDKKILSKSLKINTLKKILINTKISIEDYIENYIIVFNHNEDRNKCLRLEKYFIEILGTKESVYGVLKTGSLTNQLRGGIANPILIGEKNGFYGKHHTQETILMQKKNQQWFLDKYGSSYGYLKETNMSKYLECVEANRKSRLEYLSRCTEEEKSNFAKKAWITKHENDLKYPEQKIEREKNRREAYINTFSNRTIEENNLTNLKRKLTIENIKETNPDKWEETSKKMYSSGKERWKNMSSGEREDILNKMQLKTDKYWNDYYSNENIRSNRMDKNIYHVKKSELSDSEYQEFCKEKVGGEHNPNYGNGHKQSGSKNGRAKLFLVTDKNEQFICYGNLGKFIQDYKDKWFLQYPKSKNFKNQIFKDNSTDNFKKKWGHVSIKEISKEEYLNTYSNVKMYE